jgi:hypothetical protein
LPAGIRPRANARGNLETRAMRIRNLHTTIFLLAVSTVLPVLSFASSSPPLHLSGTVNIDQTRVSFLISGNGGGGTLHYRGQSYPVAIGGLGVGGIGVSKLVASGNVYNLTDPSKFTGMYGEVRTGYAAGDNANGKLWLKNGDGVVLELRGKGEGVALSLGADAVRISYK